MKTTFDMYYILKGKTPVCEHDILKWGDWFETHNRTLARNYFGENFVSTVFLGIDHSWGPVPVLFETMVFGGDHDQRQWGANTYAEAIHNHRNVCLLVTQNQNIRMKKPKNRIIKGKLLHSLFLYPKSLKQRTEELTQFFINESIKLHETKKLY